MKTIVSVITFVFSLAISTLVHSQAVEVVTNQLIQQYDLDFSSQQSEDPYRLVIGGNGALYLRDNSNGNFEKISQRINGTPAAVVSNLYSRILYEATADYSEIAYVSEDPNIVENDSGSSQDVFVYDRATGETIRVEGYQQHLGSISNMRISPTGNHVVFESDDRAFGNVPNNYLDRVLYVYDLNAGFLSSIPAPAEAAPNHPDETISSIVTATNEKFRQINSEPIFKYDAFTADGENLFFNVTGSFYETWIAGHFIYNLQTAAFSRFEPGNQDFNYSGRPETLALGNNLYLYPIWDLNSQVFPVRNLRIYDSTTNQISRVHQASRQNENLALGQVSDNKRYTVFFSTAYNYAHETTINYYAGVLLVMDTQSGEVRPAFYLPYGEGFDLQTDEVKFHNLNQYITFKANSRFLDDSIPPSSTRRDTFVVTNPFLSPSIVDGKPMINRAIDSGWFIWRESGRWYSEFVSGGSTQTFDGGITNSANIYQLSPLSVEFQSNDVLATAAGNLYFSLNVTGPWYDGYTFVNGAGAESCVYLNSPLNANIYLGQNRLPMPNGFVLETQQACEPPAKIKTFGQPTINRALDNGIFVWQTQANTWRIEVVSGSGPQVVDINVDSEKTISQFQQISIESTDDVSISPMSLDLSLNVSPPLSISV